MRISQPAPVKELNASRDPSGEMCGEREMVPNVVSRVLIGAVVVHGPDFLVSAARADVENLRFGNAVNSAAQTQDDLVSKLVRNRSRPLRRCGVCVLLAEHLRGRNVLHVVQPALHGDVVTQRRKISKYQHGCIRRRCAPGIELHVCRSADRA